MAYGRREIHNIRYLCTKYEGSRFSEMFEAFKRLANAPPDHYPYVKRSVTTVAGSTSHYSSGKTLLRVN